VFDNIYSRIGATEWLPGGIPWGDGKPRRTPVSTIYTAGTSAPEAKNRLRGEKGAQRKISGTSGALGTEKTGRKSEGGGTKF